jgi:hypothetical protein
MAKAYPEEMEVIRTLSANARLEEKYFSKRPADVVDWGGEFSLALSLQMMP